MRHWLNYRFGSKPLPISGIWIGWGLAAGAGAVAQRPVLGPAAAPVAVGRPQGTAPARGNRRVSKFYCVPA